MKVLHICISNTYIDNWGYQENLLSRYLVKEGVDNYIIGSDRHFPPYLPYEDIVNIQRKGQHYISDESAITRIKTTRLSLLLIFPHGLYKEIKRIKPDVILHHNPNCTSLVIAARYARQHNISLFIDNHIDEINKTPNKIWSYLIHNCLIRYACRLYMNNIDHFFGVTQFRCDFLKKYYNIPESKVSFLPIGVDVDLADSLDDKGSIRKRYLLANNALVIVSGGKMDKRKGTDILIKAVNKLSKQNDNIILVLFGRINDTETQKLADESIVVKQFGWCDRETAMSLLKMADVACWPIHHTTLCEDAIAVGTPLIIRRTKTTEHLIDGNGYWLSNGTEDELLNTLNTFIRLNENDRKIMSEQSSIMRDKLSYKTLAKTFLTFVKNTNKLYE